MATNQERFWSRRGARTASPINRQVRVTLETYVCKSVEAFRGRLEETKT